MPTKNYNLKYDVIVIGAGHAGCEAALAAARRNAKTLLISINMDTMELMPYGNELGGYGQDLLIKEVDLMGGEILNNIKNNYISKRIEEKRKNCPFEAIKVLVDRKRYSLSIKKVLENQINLDLRQGLVVDICKNGEQYNLKTSDGIVYSACCVVVCAGTFLDGKIFWGNYKLEAGRHGEICSRRLLRNLKKYGFKFKIIKKYIAPTVDSKTIKKEELEKHEYKEENENLLFIKDLEIKNKMYGYKAYINKDFLKGILRSKGEVISISKNNNIYEADNIPIEEWISGSKNIGNREIFINQTGRETTEAYLQGFETALQEELQTEILKKINGFEEIEITRPGYGIEYDILAPFQLRGDMQSKIMEGIYFAGLINGTAGYEESAAQGMVAGINASRKSEELNSIYFKKEDSCTGMLVDSIISGNRGGQLYRINPELKEYVNYYKRDISAKKLINF
jgi:tRNA uridine 5-carboxymethylaminomethyl modification enzyme